MKMLHNILFEKSLFLKNEANEEKKQIIEWWNEILYFGIFSIANLF